MRRLIVYLAAFIGDFCIGIVIWLLVIWFLNILIGCSDG